MRRLLPDTLVGRTILVLLVGLVLTQLAGAVLFTLNRTEIANRVGSRQTVERIAAAVQLVESTERADRGRVVRALEAPGLRTGWGLEPLVVLEGQEPDGAAIQEALAEKLPGHQILTEVQIPPPFPPPPDGDRPPPDGERFGRPPPPPEMTEHGPAPGPGMMRRPRPGRLLRVAVRLDDGSWLNFSASLAFDDQRLFHPNVFVPLGAGLLVVIFLSVLAVRRAVRPLAVLSAAAQRLGRDVNAPPVPVNGSKEVRAAAQAFNEMQTRLKRFIDDRTQMVAAISHDLRTPITRLKLRAEFLEDDEQREKILTDLDEMEAMIASTLAFARDDAAREARQPLDLAEMVATLCPEFGASYAGPPRLMASVGAIGLKRAFANLLDNARKYGDGGELTLAEEGGHIVVIIDDHGPGIPEDERENVFAPFYRIESSRNRETGGTGLGLAVARSAVRSHGGDIILANRPQGGLRATVLLPAG